MLCWRIYNIFVICSQEYNYPEVRDRQFLLTMYRHSKKANLDLGRYNVLRDQIHGVKYDLQRLRDPLQLQLPLNQLEKEREGDADPKI